jgi:hypothetical protein
VFSPRAAFAVCSNPTPSGPFIVTCSAGNYNAINYNPTGRPIDLTLEQGVHVVIPPGAGGVHAVSIQNAQGPLPSNSTLDDPATLTVTGATITNTGSPGQNSGLRIQSSGTATITATDTAIDVSGGIKTKGIWAIVLEGVSGDSIVTYGGPSITVHGGANSSGIEAENDGNGNASIVAAGDLTVVKANDPDIFVFGLLAKSVGGDASVHYTGGTIEVSGSVPVGIQASSRGDRSATVITDGGTINLSDTQFGGEGVLVMSSGTAASGRALTANVASKIMSAGPASIDPDNFPNGIFAWSRRDAPILVNYTGPGITTKGGNGSGIYALSGGGTITVNSSGPIDTTDGSNAIGIFADSSGASGRSDKLVTEPGTTIIGPQAASTTVTINATDVLTMGHFGTAISATAGGDVAVNVSGSVMGGWQADLDSVGSVSLLPAAGVVVGSTSGVATLTNKGSIGALSDRAVVGETQLRGKITNTGTITGYAELGRGAFDIINNGDFDLRHVADTNGNDTRDTLRVAATTAPANSSTFTNNGNSLSLLGAPGVTTVDNSGQYLPFGNANNAIPTGLSKGTPDLCKGSCWASPVSPTTAQSTFRPTRQRVTSW